jgi:hypothetical protein
MNKYQKLASNTFVLALGQFGSKFLVYVMLRFYTSWLGADGFGDVNNIINASALLISVVTLSINEGVLRYALDDTIRKKNHVLSIGINVALIGLVIFAAFVPLIGMIDMLSGYQWLIYMYVATGSIKGICAIYVRARGRVGLYAIDGTLTTIVVILLNILLLGAPSGSCGLRAFHFPRRHDLHRIPDLESRTAQAVQTSRQRPRACKGHDTVQRTAHAYRSHVVDNQRFRYVHGHCYPRKRRKRRLLLRVQVPEPRRASGRDILTGMAYVRDNRAELTKGQRVLLQRVQHDADYYVHHRGGYPAGSAPDNHAVLRQQGI